MVRDPSLSKLTEGNQIWITFWSQSHVLQLDFAIICEQDKYNSDFFYLINLSRRHYKVDAFSSYIDKQALIVLELMRGIQIQEQSAIGLDLL